LQAQGVAYYNGAGVFSAPTVAQYATVVGDANNSITTVGPGTIHYPLVSGGASANPSYALLTVPGGGSGAATLTGVLTGNGASAFTASAVTQHDVLIGGTSNAIVSVSPGTSGFVLTSNGASSDPSFQALPSISYPSQYDTLASTGSALEGIAPGTAGYVLTSNGASSYPTYQALSYAAEPWVVVTGSSQAMSSNTGYIANGGAGAVAFTFPTTPNAGDVVEVTGLTSASGWTIAIASGDSVQLGVDTATATLASTQNSDTFRAVCAIAGGAGANQWIILSAFGNISYS